MRTVDEVTDEEGWFSKDKVGKGDRAMGWRRHAIPFHGSLRHRISNGIMSIS